MENDENNREKKVRILIIGDEPELCEQVAQILRQQNAVDTAGEVVVAPEYIFTGPVPVI
jgi:DNA-binding response OmpR family regulator